MLNYELLKLLPTDIMINHIMPYTYSIQPKILLFDIRSFYQDLSLVENVYFIDYNNYMLLNDLLIFCNSNIGRQLCIIGDYNIIKRTFMLWGKSQQIIDYYIMNIFHKNRKYKPNSKVKFIWGLLTPIERTRFINKYVLE
jgi:hypothetical protein